METMETKTGTERVLVDPFSNLREQIDLYNNNFGELLNNNYLDANGINAFAMQLFSRNNTDLTLGKYIERTVYVVRKDGILEVSIQLQIRNHQEKRAFIDLREMDQNNAYLMYTEDRKLKRKRKLDDSELSHITFDMFMTLGNIGKRKQIQKDLEMLSTKEGTLALTALANGPSLRS